MPFHVQTSSTEYIHYLYSVTDQRIYVETQNNTAGGIPAQANSGEYYLINAAGNVVSIYNKANVKDATFYFYGADGRIGHYDTHLAKTTAYVKDYLGNTRITLTSADPANPVENVYDYLPYGDILKTHQTGQTNEKYLSTENERDLATGLDYRNARYSDPIVGRFLSVDPMAHMRESLSPYNYCSNNPINRVDPDGRLDDWVGTKNEDGTTTWTWDANITSQEQATAAGYDTYSKPGKIINTTGGERVRLGEEGAIHTGIIGIHSNVGPDAGLTDGHAWISTSTVDGNLMNTYSLWPDEHPLFQGQDPSGNISDVRTDTELNAGYASASGNYSYYRYITKSQSNNLNGFIGTSDTWGYTHTCADWSRDAFKAATGIRLNVDDWFGLETPRKLSGTIIKLGANTPQTPATNENRNGSSR